MLKPTTLSLVVLALLSWGGLAPAPVVAQEINATATEEQPVREIYVPFEDLNVVLEGQPRRVFLTREEYRDGLARVERLCDWLRPAAVCFVGLAGWRAAVERRAVPGWQDRTLGGRPVYVMPSTSGLNAATPASALVEHLRAAATST